MSKRPITALKPNLFVKESHGIPHYVQIAEGVQSRLNSSEWHAGERFGTIQELADVFGVSRLTVKHALKPFIEKGILVSRRGKGLYLRCTISEPPRMTLQADWDTHLKISENTEVKLLFNERVAHCPWDMSEFKQIPTWLQYMRRVHGKDGSPYGLIEAYFDADLYDLSPRQFEDDPILIVINRLKSKLITQAKQKVTVSRASSVIAQLLKIPIGEPVACVRRIASDKNGRMVYYAHVTYPGNKIEIDVDIIIPAK